MTKLNFYLTTLFLICGSIITGYAFQIVGPAKCDYADWYKEKEPNCDGCITSVELIEYNGEVFVAFWADNPICSDAQTVIYNCDGTVFCKEGGIQGLTECSDAGVVTNKKLKPNYTIIKTIWSNEVDCEPGCCVSYKDFVKRTEAPFFTNAPNLDNCKLQLALTALSSCDQVKIDLGDGTSQGPFNGNFSLTHTYANPGTYTVCMYFTEIDENGKTCWEAANCFEVYADCEPDICCVDEAAFIKRTDNILINSDGCDLNVNIPDLIKCDQTIIDWGDSNSEGPFMDNINLMHTYTTSGTYTICLYFTEIDENGTACWEAADCIEVDINCKPGICCVDYAAFVDRTEDVTINSKDCDLNIEIPLIKCDQVNIDWGDGSANASYTGYINEIHTYPATGTYTLCMYFTEFDKSGTACWEAADCIEVKVNCDCCDEIEALKERVSYLEEMVILLNTQFEALNERVGQRVSENKLHIYPNPSKGNLYAEYIIKETSNNAKLVITNAEGIEVSTTKINCTGNCKSNLKLPNNLSAGIYYCTLYVNDILIESTPFVYQQ